MQNYVEAELQIVAFDAEDVITTSIIDLGESWWVAYATCLETHKLLKWMETLAIQPS